MACLNEGLINVSWEEQVKNSRNVRGWNGIVGSRVWGLGTGEGADHGLETKYWRGQRVCELATGGPAGCILRYWRDGKERDLKLRLLGDFGSATGWMWSPQAFFTLNPWVSDLLIPSRGEQLRNGILIGWISFSVNHKCKVKHQMSELEFFWFLPSRQPDEPILPTSDQYWVLFCWAF